MMRTAIALQIETYGVFWYRAVLWHCGLITHRVAPHRMKPHNIYTAHRTAERTALHAAPHRTPVCQ